MSNRFNLLLTIYLVSTLCPGSLPAVDFPLPDTTQSKCFDNENQISCPIEGEPYFGQDGNYVGVQPAYKDNSDGTVTDIVNGLMWQQSDDGTNRNWQEADQYCNSLGLGEYDDWRLPSVHELESITDSGVFNPSFNNQAFCGTSSFYWSGTSLVDNPDNAWPLSFDAGSVPYISSKMDEFSVRCVRDASNQSAEISNALVLGMDGQTRFDTNRFVDNADGTVSDIATGLMWMQADDGIQRNWQQSLSSCENLVFPESGYSDWRLPNKHDLVSIIDYSKSFPAMDPVFQGSSYYWTSTTKINETANAWAVLFGYGGVYGEDKANMHYVRCVRDGNFGSMDQLPVYIESSGNCGEGKLPCYQTVQDGLNVVTRPGVLVKIAAQSFLSDIIVSKVGDYTLEGGNGSGFDDYTGFSVIEGNLTVKANHVEIKNISVK